VRYVFFSARVLAVQRSSSYPPNRVDEILLFRKELLDMNTDSAYIFPMCRDDFDKVRIVGQGFDQKLPQNL